MARYVNRKPWICKRIPPPKGTCFLFRYAVHIGKGSRYLLAANEDALEELGVCGELLKIQLEQGDAQLFKKGSVPIAHAR